MRLKYYILSLRQMKIKKSFVFLLIIIVFAIFIAYIVNKKVEPLVSSLCDIRAKNIALQVTNETVNEYIKNITYTSLMDIKQNNDGKIISMTANVTQMNKLTTDISAAIQERIKNLETNTIKIPLGSILNLGIFSGYGPNIKINIVPAGSVTAKFKSEFEQAGINQTRNRIYLEITTSMNIVAPFYADTQTYVDEIVVAETIIVGDIPSTYYNLNGLTEDNAVNVIK